MSSRILPGHGSVDQRIISASLNLFDGRRCVNDLNVTSAW